MDEKQKIEKLKEIFADKDFTAKVLEMETPEEVQKAVKTKGVEMSLEEIDSIKDFVEKNSEGEELTDDQLENVAGGSITVAAVVGGIIIGGAVISGAVTLGRAVNNWTRRRW
ncbi:MAG: Nif11-like leader peptide family RiPP precursor [Selenomonadaceae bacterium]|nr:Nif11-like leader peptide family RiPP precursor [Selenomonadaceae bacterium]